MSVVQNPIIGRSSGKFANAIFQTQYNRNILRSKPLQVSQPNSKAQIHSRAEFKLAGELAGHMNKFTNRLYLASSYRMPAAAVVVKWLINNAISTSGEDVILDPNYLLPVIDSLNLSTLFTVDKEIQDRIVVNWSEYEILDIVGTDSKIYGLLYNIDTGTFYNEDMESGPSNEALYFTVPGNNIGINFICYVLCQRFNANYKPQNEFFQAFYQ